MPKLLTVAIPSFNRASKLDKQLGWLSRNMAGFEDRCEVIISDNASTDATPEICRKHGAEFSARGVQVRVNRNEKNLGPLPNIARCIELAQTRFVWVIGDDDHIPDETFAFVLRKLEANPELASIVMNFQSVGLTEYDRCFHFASDELGDGKRIVSQCLLQAYFGLAFMTAQVYRSEFAREALLAWPEGRTNYDFQIFLSAFVATKGHVLATSETHVQYVTGDNVYERNKRIGLILFADSLQVFTHLRRIGYDGALCRKLARTHVRTFKRRFVTGALRNNPMLSAQTAGRAFWHLARLSLPVLPK